MADQVCSNCGRVFGPGDLFCEGCGFEPVTGSVPEESTAPAKAGSVKPPPDGADPDAAGSQSPSVGLPSVTVTVGIDAAYFEAAVTDELELPDPVAADLTIEVPGTEIHIGRTSESRAIHPDLDIASLTGDPAVSSRHAIITRDQSGDYTIVDVGSTNGTFVAEVDSKPITAGEAIPIEPGVPIYLGAWTRIVIG